MLMMFYVADRWLALLLGVSALLAASGLLLLAL
jgi:hypothetical protein